MLEMDEQITIKMTRAEGAALVIAASMAEQLPAGVAPFAESAVKILQGSGAPMGVITRFLGSLHTPESEQT